MNVAICVDEWDPMALHGQVRRYGIGGTLKDFGEGLGCDLFVLSVVCTTYTVFHLLTEVS